MNNPFSLDGTTTLITGASSGIGRATAIQISKMGGRCFLTGRDMDRLEETWSSLQGEKHILLPGNLSDEGFTDDLVKKTVAEVGPLSGFVHCAGMEKTLPFRSATLEDLHEIMKINLEVFWILCQQILRNGMHEKNLSIVGIASMAAKLGIPGNTIYSTSKGALLSLVRTLAMEYAPKGIRFNCVCPGYVQTPMLEKLKALYANEEKFFSDMNRLHPLGLGKAEDVANAIAFLLAPASRWITGCAIDVDGGYGCQ